MSTEQNTNEARVSGSELNALLAHAIGSSLEDFGDEHLETLLLIGQGMFWSKELDIAARELAQKVKDEFERFSNARSMAE